ncbi:hypothetical protein Baya_13847 [Bagarius yarrelli]|uniref:Uncharacterized protein n=1 Tax=Bagarius yarrelli TaxID=175774 RepID=A0A556V728_BAGYA|nr:hypothetical protein Baya_13847 [Bagarius yarrelli]
MSKAHSVDGTDGFETVWADAVREINLLFSKYSEVLRRLLPTDLVVSGCVECAHRERAAVDELQVQELMDILREAVILESQLKEKKEHLRRALAIISDKLQK